MRALLLLLVLGAPACFGLPSRHQLIEVSSARLKCPVDSMEVAIISDTSCWVRGCGQFATYELDCATTGTCAWRLAGKVIPRQ